MNKKVVRALAPALLLLLFSPACRSMKTGRDGRTTPTPPPAPRATAAPAPSGPPGALPPGAIPLPVATPSSPSHYDRAPGVLYEETRPPRPTPTPTPS